MDIFEFAMQIEKEGENYYREIADKCDDEGLKKIMIMLSDDEVKHYNTLMKMKDSIEVQFEDTGILSAAKNVFIDLKEKDDTFDFDASQTEIYKKAQEIEKKSEDFYRKKSFEVNDENQKSIILKIAEEEKKHYFLLENIIEFVSRPETWIENAEFNHLDEY